MSRIPSQAEYHSNELRTYRLQIERIEKAPLSERKEGKAEYLDAMKKYPELVAERIGWMLVGNYGYAPQFHALNIINAKRGNKTAQLGQMICSLEWNCPALFAMKAYNELSTEEQTVLNNAIEKEIADYKTNQENN